MGSGDREKFDPITGVNPPFNETGPPEERNMGETDKAIATRSRLLNFHRNNGSMSGFYELYPLERPVTFDRPPEAVRSLAETIHKHMQSERAHPQPQPSRDPAGKELER